MECGVQMSVMFHRVVKSCSKLGNKKAPFQVSTSIPDKGPQNKRKYLAIVSVNYYYNIIYCNNLLLHKIWGG